MTNTTGWRSTLLEYIKIVAGVALTAIGLNLFLIPNKIAAGGVSGIATVTFHIFHLPVGAVMLAMNIILFIVGALVIGKGFGLRTILASGLLSLFIDLFAWLIPWPQATDDLLIAVVFGVLLTGSGMAIVFNQNASTGGTDIIARILARYSNINIGRALLLIDFVVAAGAGLLLHSADVAMYSLLAVLANCFAIDAFIDTFNISKKVLVISRQSANIADRAMRELNRGATMLPVAGAFTGENGVMMMMIVRPRQTAQLRQIVRETDPEAFMIISNVNQVLGRGFRSFLDPAADI